MNRESEAGLRVELGMDGRGWAAMIGQKARMHIDAAKRHHFQGLRRQDLIAMIGHQHVDPMRAERGVECIAVHLRFFQQGYSQLRHTVAQGHTFRCVVRRCMERPRNPWHGKIRGKIGQQRQA